jgi:hypothetical protein
MARALECPACGARHRIETLPDAPTFRCDRCGQALKVPTPVSSAGSDGPPPPARRSGTAPVAPPPRRADPAQQNGPAADTATQAAPVRTAAAVSATVASAGPVEEAEEARRRERRPARSTGPKKRVAWWWRLLAWIVAVPVGFVITAWPAYELGFIKKDDVLDIFVGTGSGRYVRLAIATAVWALVTALLVQLFVEGGRAWAARRKARAVPA